LLKKRSGYLPPLPPERSDKSMSSNVIKDGGKREEEEQDKWENSWKDFYRERIILEVKEDKNKKEEEEGDGVDKFSVYCSGNFEIVEEEITLFILLHGGGHSALSWGPVAKLLGCKSCNILSFDYRGHGRTECKDQSNLSISRLSSDVENVIVSFKKFKHWDKVIVKVIFVGHSLGGAVAVHSS